LYVFLLGLALRTDTSFSDTAFSFVIFTIKNRLMLLNGIVRY
jgi:hypothetical protein